MKESFSFQEIHKVINIKPGQLLYIRASDGIKLAYRRYSPQYPKAVVIFYHGGGAHSGCGYQYLGNSLKTRYEIDVYTPDIRGHGFSEGPRGDAPNPEQVWTDITTILKLVREEYPKIPIFIGGHSSGAGLTLNYASQNNHLPFSGCIFLSPFLGYKAETDRPDITAPFANVDRSAFLSYATSGGVKQAHDYAVKFNYPVQILSADPLVVSAITVAMSIALTPFSPHEQFANLSYPFGLWIGSNDELFIPERVVSFAKMVRTVIPNMQTGIIDGAKHLSVLLNADKVIGPWILSCLKDENSNESV